MFIKLQIFLKARRWKVQTAQVLFLRKLLRRLKSELRRLELEIGTRWAQEGKSLLYFDRRLKEVEIPIKIERRIHDTTVRIYNLEDERNELHTQIVGLKARQYFGWKCLGTIC